MSGAIQSEHTAISYDDLLKLLSDNYLSFKKHVNSTPLAQELEKSKLQLKNLVTVYLLAGGLPKNIYSMYGEEDITYLKKKIFSILTKTQLDTIRNPSDQENVELIKSTQEKIRILGLHILGLIGPESDMKTYIEQKKHVKHALEKLAEYLSAFKEHEIKFEVIKLKTYLSIQLSLHQLTADNIKDILNKIDKVSRKVLSKYASASNALTKQ